MDKIDSFIYALLWFVVLGFFVILRAIGETFDYRWLIQAIGISTVAGFGFYAGATVMKGKKEEK